MAGHLLPQSLSPTCSHQQLARLAGLSWDVFREEADDAAERLNMPLDRLHAAVAQRRKRMEEAQGGASLGADDASDGAGEKAAEPPQDAYQASKLAEEEIRRLATLSEVAFAGQRKAAAHRLGIGVAALDAAVKRARGKETPKKENLKPIKPPPKVGRDGRKVIPSAAGELDQMATLAEAAIMQGGVPIYQRAHELVRPVTREVPASHGRTTMAAGLAALTSPAVRDALCGVAEFCSYDKRSQDWRVIDPPGDVAAILLAREGRWRLPALGGVITTPTLRPDGSLLSEPGYDASTRLYHFAAPDLRLTPGARNPQPTRVQAEAALQFLKNLLVEFPFVPGGGEGEPKAGTALTVALSGCITPVVRGAMSISPLHAFRASTAGTGKSYMVDVASAIATGRLCPVTSVAPEEAETEKRLTGLLLSGYPVVSLDNVNGELGGDILAQSTERTMLRLRPLGTSRMVEIENRAMIFATGNNLRVRGDMVRRVMVCDLDAGVERPELRTFKGDPVATVLRARGAYVSAALVIVRAYLAADTPDLLDPVQSYSDWSRLVRSALVWLGCADPAGSMDAARADDPELIEHREIITAWRSALGAEGHTSKEMADAVNRKKESKMGEPTDYLFPDLRDALLRLVGERGEINTKRLGKWLTGRQGRIVDGLRFKRSATDAHGGVARWPVEKV